METKMKDMSLAAKLFEIKRDIEKIDKDVQGFNFKYEDPESIVKAVIKQLEQKGIDHHMSMHIPTQFEKDGNDLIQITETNKQGKEKVQWISRFKIDHTYIDKKTGETMTFMGIGSGKADQPGQADGAAWSYARRQEYEKRFAITIDKEQETGLDLKLKYVPDEDGNASEVLKETKFLDIKKLIQTSLKVENASNMVAKVNEVVDRLNKEKKTSYKKLSLIADKYAEDVIKIISMMVHDA